MLGTSETEAAAKYVLLSDWNQHHDPGRGSGFAIGESIHDWSMAPGGLEMALEVQVRKRGIELSDLEQKRIDRQIEGLAKRVEKFPDPRLELAIEEHKSPPRVTADLRIALGTTGGHLVSHEEASTADAAVKAASEDIKRQLEKRLASMRGEDSYGVPSRRLPDELRPNPPSGNSADVVEDEDLEEELDEDSDAI